MGRDHHDQEEEHGDHADHRQNGEPYRAASKTNPNVERHPIGPRCVRIAKAQHQERDQHEQVAVGRTERIQVRQDVNRRVAATLSRKDKGKNRNRHGSDAEDDDGSRGGLVARVYPVEPGWQYLELAH